MGGTKGEVNGTETFIYAPPSLPLVRSWVALDMETTGFDREKDRIIEIAAIRFTEGEPVAVFNTMVRQDLNEHPISLEIIKATGHTEADIMKGMDEETAIHILDQFCSEITEGGEEIDSMIVGHNILFDYEFFRKAAERCDRGYPLHHGLIDTLTIARDRHQYPHKLPDMCAKYHILQDNWHSAYFDALATGQLLLAMDREKPVMEYLNVIGWKRQYGAPSWAPDYVTLKPQGNLNIKEGGK
jgi:DNA polymerase III epsilon subunit-like protein